MPDSKKSIKQLYDEGMAEVFKIVGTIGATPEQRNTAKQTAEDLSSMLVTHTLQSIEGRSALLSGLIVELNQVIETVQTDPRYQEVLSNITGVLTKAQQLFVSEKKDMI